MMAETFHGYIETTQDVLLVFEGCRRGLLPRICRRLQERERKLIRSGSIFVFDERESGIKRWTDGRVWSPSRILGNFLIYRELDKRIPGDRRLSSSPGTGRSFSLDGSIDRQKEKQLIGSLSDSYKFKEDGLIKKTMSITVNGVAQHLISYYNPREVLQNRLRLPSSVPELASLEISPELLVKQNFRVPPLVEPTFDQNETELTHRQHAYRSMSAGSIRGQERHMELIRNEHLPPYPSPFQRLDMEQRSTHMYGQSPSFPPNIPSNIASSPSTPMIPQPRSYNHQRHYSTSSASSFPRPELHPQAYHERQLPQCAAPQSDIHGYQPPIDNNIKNENQERLATPNLGQLLNPIHPLHNSNSGQPMEYNNYSTYNNEGKQQENNTLQPMEYNYQALSNSEKDSSRESPMGIVNYVHYQSAHPLQSQVENLGLFQNNNNPSFQQGQQDQNNMSSLINGLK